jgi:hypothetical protein
MIKGAAALMVAGTFLFTHSVFAQTVANGPYYAEPAWDQQMAPSTRFVVLANMNSDAVLDRETGLVWDRQPKRHEFDGKTCHDALGNRYGWRLPSVSEVLSLIDATTGDLPVGHPFQFPGSTFSGSFATSSVWFESIPNTFTIVVVTGGGIAPRAVGLGVAADQWCVRGGSGPPEQL